MALTHHRVDHLRAMFPGWNIFQTDAGRWWAWKKLTMAQVRAGCRGALDADTADGLAAKLKEQTEKRLAVAG